MRRFNYFCKNCDCGDQSSKFTLDVNDNEDHKKMRCPNNRKKFLKVLGEIQHGGFSVFGMMSQDEKKAMFKKRARDHEKKLKKEMIIEKTRKASKM